MASAPPGRLDPYGQTILDVLPAGVWGHRSAPIDFMSRGGVAAQVPGNS